MHRESGVIFFPADHPSRPNWGNTGRWGFPFFTPPCCRIGATTSQDATPIQKWRAKRHYIPGHVWHLTHRCHKREFLLKFAKDRRRWLHWLLEAKRRYGLVILNYMVTTNHIHLLVVDDGDRDVIPRSIQLVAEVGGRTKLRIAWGMEHRA